MSTNDLNHFEGQLIEVITFIDTGQLYKILLSLFLPKIFETWTTQS